mmetsp:Transcript_10473/g.18913  ORF Transcript_10473/g.18913 Transcript_10473/m.18913 type:complete len:208 (+) Transcript_10473:719-1342(+)
MSSTSSSLSTRDRNDKSFKVCPTTQRPRLMRYCSKVMISIMPKCGVARVTKFMGCTRFAPNQPSSSRRRTAYRAYNPPSEWQTRESLPIVGTLSLINFARRRPPRATPSRVRPVFTFELMTCIWLGEDVLGPSWASSVSRTRFRSFGRPMIPCCKITTCGAGSPSCAAGTWLLPLALHKFPQHSTRCVSVEHLACSSAGNCCLPIVH